METSTLWTQGIIASRSLIQLGISNLRLAQVAGLIFHQAWLLIKKGTFTLPTHSIRSDTRNNRIQKFDPAGNFKSQIGSSSRFNFPSGVALDKEGNIYVADTLNNLIQKFNPGGIFKFK